MLHCALPVNKKKIMDHMLSLFRQQLIISECVDLKLDLAAFRHNEKRNNYLHNNYLYWSGLHPWIWIRHLALIQLTLLQLPSERQVGFKMTKSKILPLL